MFPGDDRYTVRPCRGQNRIIRRGSVTSSQRLDFDQQIIRQRSLQRLRLIPRRTKPNLDLFRFGQDDRHRLRVYRLNSAIWLASEKGEDVGFNLAFLPMHSSGLAGMATAGCWEPSVRKRFRSTLFS